MHEIILTISNTIGIYYVLYHVINWRVFWRKPPEFLPKPFDCNFCMMFWAGIIATVIQLLFLNFASYLFFITLPLSISYILIFNKNE